ncbi:MAG: pentapeptide repeat-containing protein [Cyanobacteria bacterium P01_G01_bin.19]
MPTTASSSKSPLAAILIEKLNAGDSLTDADYSNQDLYAIALNQANLAGINFAYSVLTNADLIDANLTGANLINTDLRGANLTGANLTGANLTGAYLSRADLRQANLTDANLEDAKFQLAIYDRDTVFPEGFNYKSSGAVGPAANLTGAFLNTANLRRVDLTGARMIGAYLSGADLTGAILDDVSFSGANLQKAILTGASLRGARLGNAELKGVDFRAADFTGASLDNIQNVAGADFSMAVGLDDAARAAILKFSAQDLTTWNAYTRCNTKDSLEIKS